MRTLQALFVLTIVSCTTRQGQALTEREILERFFDSCFGLQWVNNTNWKQPSTSICTWHGITCTRDSSNATHVEKIDLSDNNVVGELEPTLYELPLLKEIKLDNNPITDAGLDGLNSSSVLERFQCISCLLESLHGVGFAASSLQDLRLSNNNFRQFPTGLFLLSNLKRLDFDHQKLKGFFPPGIGLLTSLTDLNLASLPLSGPIPKEIGNLQQLLSLDMSLNYFSGTLPTEIEKLTLLRELKLERNLLSEPSGRLTGPLPHLSNMKGLTRVHLSNQEFIGPVPADFMGGIIIKDDATVYVQLDGNALNGTLLDLALDRVVRLNLDLGGNNFTGPLPPAWCSKRLWMSGLVESYGCDAIICSVATYNDEGVQKDPSKPCLSCKLQTHDSAELLGRNSCPGVSGTQEPDLQVLFELYWSLEGGRWKNKDGWKGFDNAVRAHFFGQTVIIPELDFCSFHGIICDGEGRVYLVKLSENGLVGTVPAALLSLPGLREVDLSDNHVTVDFSDVSLAGDYLSSIKLSNVDKILSRGISRISSLEHVYFDGSPLSPSALLSSSDLWNLSGLETLHLESCSLSGSIPSEIQTLTRLRSLYLHSNQLEGSIPTELATLSQLQDLELSDNDISGTIPSHITAMKSLVHLKVNGARGGLVGSLPSFEEASNLQTLELSFNLLSGPIPDSFMSAASSDGKAVAVRLIGNQLSGTVPSSLSRFDSLFLEIQDNEITGVSDVLCTKNSWMHGAVGTLAVGCDSLLCPAGSWSVDGRITSSEQQCAPCSTNNYFGQTNCEAGSLGSSEERKILNAFYAATGGRYWTAAHANWTKSGVPICYREGVVCGKASNDLNSGVTELRLNGHGLRGRVPASVFDIPHLRRLAVSDNEIDIPLQSIGKASHLETLHMSNTNVRSLAGIETASKALFGIHSGGNDLSGTFPAELLMLTTLRNVFLENNRLTGPLPPTLGVLSDLRSLHLAHNLITGTLPRSLGSMTLMRTLELQENSMSGLLPIELAYLPALQTLNLYSQAGPKKFSGPLLSFASSPAVTHFDLHANNFAGTLPTNLLAAASIGGTVFVDLSFNRFAGEIPVDLAQKFDLHLQANHIDKVPLALCNVSASGVTFPCDAVLCRPGTSAENGKATVNEECTSCKTRNEAPFYGSVQCDSTRGKSERSALEKLYEATEGNGWTQNRNWGTNESICLWHGVTCNRNDFVEEISLEHNGLQQAAGTSYDLIGTLLQSLADLKALDLQGNSMLLDLSGIPDECQLETMRLSGNSVDSGSLSHLRRAEKLISLHLTGCELRGSFPPEILALSNLKELYLSFNTLSGTIPTGFSSLQNLEELYVYENSFFGSIPSEIGSLSTLRSLVLGSNFLSGTFPKEVAKLPDLQEVSVNSQKGAKKLSGQLPSFVNATRLRYIDLSRNDLSGTLPPDLLGANELEEVTVRLDKNRISGQIPESLSLVSRLVLDIADNRISHLPPSLCNQVGWMDGKVEEYGCDAILCPIGREGGRLESKVEACSPCSSEGDNVYMGTTECTPPLVERQVLEDLYYNCNGEAWARNDFWNSIADICDWYGVGCDDHGRVVVLNLEKNVIKCAVIPTELHRFPKLQALQLGADHPEL